MKIYTGRGDEGQTDLRDMTRVSKGSYRIEAYGNVDEVNSIIGTIRPTGYDDIDEILLAVQNHLHIVQADFANPDPDPDEGSPVIEQRHVDEIESWIDECSEEVSELEAFILPGGSQSGAKLHHARSVCRRAERRSVSLINEEDANETAVTYLNRLSDLLFQLGRLVNDRDGVEEENPSY